MDDYYISDNDSEFEVDVDDEEVEKRDEEEQIDGGLEKNPGSESESEASDNEIIDEDELLEANEIVDPDELLEEEEEELDLKTVSKFNREIIVSKPENRRTSNVLNRYETTELISIRATQIAEYNNCLVDTTGLDDPILMAKRELMQLKCPLILRRTIGEVKDKKTGNEKIYMEFWNPNEMTFAVRYEV